MDLQAGFHLKPLGDNHFSCQKLGQLVVKINPGESAEEILPSALLSLSGDDGYRKNAATLPGDPYAFTNLFPGSFYLRPLLKVLLSKPSEKFDCRSHFCRSIDYSYRQICVVRLI